MNANDNSAPGIPPQRDREWQPPSRSLTAFLEQEQATVLNVVRGAAPGTRRLFIGDRSGESVRFVVAVATRDQQATLTAVAREEQVLTTLRRVLAPTLQETVPQVLGRLVVDGESDGLVLTGAPGLNPSGASDEHHGSRTSLGAVSAWMNALRSAAQGPAAPVDLGESATESTLTPYAGLARISSTFGQVRAARNRLAQVEVVRTITHGCLCPRHVRIEGSAVVGVDDWSLASLTGDPTRDIGICAARVAGSRLPEVMLGRTAYAANMRRFVTAGLSEIGVPRRLWRDVLLLTQLELALESLSRGDPQGVSLLHETAQATPPDH